jgi:hypothetical protein
MPRFILKFNKHRLRKNNGIVGVMYELYLAGRSLAEIAKMYGKTRQAVYDVFRSRGYKLRSKPLTGLTMIDGHRFTLTKGGYLRGTVNGRRLMAHHYVWEKHRGPIPAGHGIHFENGDRMDVRIENLSLHSIAEISSKFNPHLNQFTSPTGSRKHKLSLRDRVKAEREAQWERAMAI